MRYLIGIDLGTTNTVVAYVDLEAPVRSGGRVVEILPVPQVVAPGAVATRPWLPSFLYLPGAHELPAGSLVLPWDATRGYAVGTLARDQGAEVPGRLVASAKSWLSHGGVDRRADILPWGGAADVAKVSPVEATRRYLQHVREAWNETMGATGRFEEQQLVLTVPASFDEVARELTVQAAREAGLTRLTLLEEPLAAFYAWMRTHRAEREALQDGQLLLVCDVGGGTADFSVLGVRRAEGAAPTFERLAVGEHLMLGGDNMDYTLGRFVETDVAGRPGALDTKRWHQLVHQARGAKEILLAGTDAPDAARVTISGPGSGVVGNVFTGVLRKEEVYDLLLDGFFPAAPLDAPLEGQRRSGLTELGLPYEADPAITRHLAAFWRRAQPFLNAWADPASAVPDAVLFNGGVFEAAPLRERVREVVGGWFADVRGAGWRPQELQADRLDRAVAVGAAAYALARRGEGTRIGSGVARAYYVGIETAGPADAAQAAVCLIPRGADEGFTAHLDEQPVQALTNQPVTFHLFTSTTRTTDELGDVVQLAPGEIRALPPVRTVLKFGRKGVARALPVELGVRLTELGTLELWCDAQQTVHRWDLQFDLRQDPPAATQDHPHDAPPALDQLKKAQAVLRAAFDGPTPGAVWEDLETVLEAPRDTWSVPILRKLADTLLSLSPEGAPARELAWYDLLGYTLRPGHGGAVDDWRLGELWKQYLGGLQYGDKETHRLAWWLLWRRVGGGLPEEKQAQVYYDVRPYIQLNVRTNKAHPLYPKRLTNREKLEAWKTLASFERLPLDVKQALGQLLMQRLKQKPGVSVLWALLRLGLRTPVYGPIDRLLPAAEVAAWLKAMLHARLPKRDSVAYTLAYLAQATGDPGRDVPAALRKRVHQWLTRLPEHDAYLSTLEGTPTEAAQRWLHDDPLPPQGTPLTEPTGIRV